MKYLYALFLLGSGVKHLYNIYWADASIMATGYPEPEAQAFVTAVLATKPAAFHLHQTTAAC